MAAAFPYRIGRRNPAPVGTFDPSTISVWTVSAVAPQAPLAAALPSASGTATIAPGPACAPADPTCGFKPGTTVAAFGHSGIVDFYSVTSVAGSVLTLQHNQPDSPRMHPVASTVLAEVTERIYFVRFDAGLGYSQLRRYDGGSGADVPVVDHVVSLAFEYRRRARTAASRIQRTGANHVRTAAATVVFSSQRVSTR
ncbi:MAG: hypothetical protein QM736_21380 [Vicinamibacterales bacterium]